TMLLHLERNCGQWWTIDRFLSDNPQYAMAGVTLSQFSFQIPKPLFDGYGEKT
ncbi:hypothetical protein KI387_010256, partial [Taxus chinensis]